MANADGFDDDDAASLARDGFVVVNGWLGDAHATSLHQEHTALLDRGCFRPARTGHGAQRAEHKDVRGDVICWFDASADVDAQDGRRGVRPGPAAVDLLARLDSLRGRLNRSCFLGLRDVEVHAACYDDGAGYDAHVDVFGDDVSGRVISFSHYLNAGWVAADGGCLRMEGSAACDIAPLFDRLVVFQSRTQRHAVLPVTRRRMSSTGWMR